MSQTPLANSKFSILLILFALALGAGAVFLFAHQGRDEQNINTGLSDNTVVNVGSQLNANLAGSENSNVASNSLKYSNSRYGFSLEYPSRYEYYTGSNPDINLLFNWGINAEQELLFAISAFPLKDKTAVMKYFGAQESTETTTIGGQTAKVLSKGGLFSIDANGYFYVIDSLFPDVVNAPDRKSDYLGILDSLIFFTPQ